MPSRSIPLSLPSFGDEELEAVAVALRSGRTGGHGPIACRVEAELARSLGVRHVLLTLSATHALEMAFHAVGLQPGDEIVLPSFTFVSVANAVLRAGARPVFADISEETLDLDPELVRSIITARTRALVPAHYGGVGAPMERFRAIADEHGLTLIEDAAQGLGAWRNGRPLGTFGDIGTFSFHETKNLSCGEGGAFVTDSDEVFGAIESFYHEGTDRARFQRGEVDRYTWTGIGGKYALPDLLAAILLAQLGRMDELQSARRRVYERYMFELQPLADAGRIRLPVIPAGCDPNWHLFHIRLKTEQERDAVLASMRASGVQCAFHFIPLHDAPYARRTLGPTPELPVTERVSRTILRLPLHASLTDEQVEHVLRSLRRAVDAAVAA